MLTRAAACLAALWFTPLLLADAGDEKAAETAEIDRVQVAGDEEKAAESAEIDRVQLVAKGDESAELRVVFRSKVTGVIRHERWKVRIDDKSAVSEVYGRTPTGWWRYSPIRYWGQGALVMSVPKGKYSHCSLVRVSIPGRAEGKALRVHDSTFNSPCTHLSAAE